MTSLRKRVILVAAASLMVSGAAQAGTVLVTGESLSGFSTSTINTFYNTYGGHTSTLGTVTGSSLAGIDLLWATQPADAYTGAELDTFANYLAAGGRIAFLGEHGGFGAAQNNFINAALTFLGADIQIVNQLIDSGFRSASVGDGQILSHPLTQGVNTYQYAAFAPLTISGSAQALMLGEDDPTKIMMAYQNIGPGSIFLITDQNVWDNAASLWPNFDNEVMFDNLVEGQTGAPPVNGVPEPATWAMMLVGFGIIGAGMRRKQRQAVRYNFA
jgi:hypothetical protein